MASSPSPLTSNALIARHIDDHMRVVESLRGQQDRIERIARAMLECIGRDGCIFWFGNGGSAADSQHLACELVGRFERERPGISSIALTTDTSALTAIANDLGFDDLFARQVEALCRARDLVIGISTSGNSANVLRGIEAAQRRGATTVGLTGRDGGRLAGQVEHCLTVACDNTARIQEAHILVGHILCDLVERWSIGDNDGA